MRRGITKISVLGLGPLLNLGDDLTVVDVRRTDEDLRAGTVSLMLQGDALPEACEGDPGEMVMDVVVEFRSLYVPVRTRVVLRDDLWPEGKR